MANMAQRLERGERVETTPNLGIVILENGVDYGIDLITIKLDDESVVEYSQDVYSGYLGDWKEVTHEAWNPFK